MMTHVDELSKLVNRVLLISGAVRHRRAKDAIRPVLAEMGTTKRRTNHWAADRKMGPCSPGSPCTGSLHALCHHNLIRRDTSDLFHLCSLSLVTTRSYAHRSEQRSQHLCITRQSERFCHREEVNARAYCGSGTEADAGTRPSNSGNDSAALEYHYKKKTGR